MLRFSYSNISMWYYTCNWLHILICVQEINIFFSTFYIFFHIFIYLCTYTCNSDFSCITSYLFAPINAVHHIPNRGWIITYNFIIQILYHFRQHLFESCKFLDYFLHNYFFRNLKHFDKFYLQRLREFLSKLIYTKRLWSFSFFNILILVKIFNIFANFIFFSIRNICECFSLQCL